jgi:hypothetical protein
VFDFCQLSIQHEEAHMPTWITMSPSHAKELWRLVGEAIRRSALTYGTIADSSVQDDVQ